MSGFTTIFEIYNENSIKIVEFPKTPTKILEVELDKNIGNIITQTQKNGTLKIKREEIMEFLKDKGKMKEIYNQDKSEE
jgi:hypothetical protein